MRGWSTAGVVVALPAILTGCGAPTYQYIEPWFRVRTDAEVVIAPHALSFGGGRQPELLFEDRWRSLAHGGSFSAEKIDDTSVAVLELAPTTAGHDPVEDPRAWGASGVFIYRLGRVEPIVIPWDHCRTPRIGDAPGKIACFACESADGKTRTIDENGSCPKMHLDEYDSNGKHLGGRVFATAIVQPEIEGRLPDGQWIIAEHAPSKDFLFSSGPHDRFRLDDDGLHRLEYGSDPLGKDRDAAARAKEILRQVPIRDAAMADFEKAFAADEAEHADWVSEDEVKTHLSKGIAIEPGTKVVAGRCYRLVARSTPDLASMVLSIRYDWPDLATASPHFADPPLTTKSLVGEGSIEHCTRAGEPPLLQFRIQGGEGKGYVMGRIYSFPASAQGRRLGRSWPPPLSRGGPPPSTLRSPRWGPALG